MRTDPRYSRVRELLTDATVPRTAEGGIGLCHHCQRQVYFERGFLQVLVSDLRRAAIQRRASS